MQELLASTGPVPDVPVDAAEDVAVLPYSSGTTSLPKGVMLTHASIGVNLAQIDALHTMGPEDRIVAVLPFFHIYGMTVLMNVALRKGATVVVLPRFDLAQFIDVLEQHRITRAYVAPPVVLAMAKHPAFEGRDFSALTFILSAAAPLDAELAGRRPAAGRRDRPGVRDDRALARHPPRARRARRRGAARPASASCSPPPRRGWWTIETGEDVGIGEPGEIWIRGPQRMKGYFGRQEETDTLIDADGWLHTGDIGTVDENGWWHIVDRVKELIKYKGYQVAPAELEAVLLASPDVADAAVIGVYDERGRRGAEGVRRPGAGQHRDRGRRPGLRRRAHRAVQAGAPGGVHRGRAEVGQRQDPAPRAARPVGQAGSPSSAPSAGSSECGVWPPASSPGSGAPSAGSLVCDGCAGSVMAVLCPVGQCRNAASGTAGSSAWTAASSGSASRAPGPVVDSAAAATAYRTAAGRSSPRASACARAPQKQSPAPVVSTGVDRRRRLQQRGAPSAGTTSAPRAPRVTTTEPEATERASSASSAGGRSPGSTPASCASSCSLGTRTSTRSSSSGGQRLRRAPG